MVVDPLVQLSLELLLGHAHQEVSDELGNGLSHGPDDNLEVRVNTSADLLDEDVGAAAGVGLPLRLGLWLVLWLLLNQVTVLVILRHVLLLRHYRCAVLFVVLIVHEHVVLL